MSKLPSSRARLTPSAMRTAISRRRLSARASSRLPTLAHAMSKTMERDAEEPRRDLRVGAVRSGRGRERGPAIARGFAISIGVASRIHRELLRGSSGDTTR